MENQLQLFLATNLIWSTSMKEEIHLNTSTSRWHRLEKKNSDEK